MDSYKKTKVTFDCSMEEKIYIKMLAAKANMTLGEYVLSHLREDFPKSQQKPNKDTLKAMKESQEGKGMIYESMDDFWNEMGVKPSDKR